MISGPRVGARHCRTVDDSGFQMSQHTTCAVLNATACGFFFSPLPSPPLPLRLSSFRPTNLENGGDRQIDGAVVVLQVLGAAEDRHLASGARGSTADPHKDFGAGVNDEDVIGGQVSVGVAAVGSRLHLLQRVLVLRVVEHAVDVKVDLRARKEGSSVIEVRDVEKKVSTDVLETTEIRVRAREREE